MTNIIAFGASNSRNSINQAFVRWAASQVPGAEIKVLDLNDFEMPIYSIDRERKSGIPENAVRFKSLIKNADALIISLAEHNGSYTAAFKNILDWTSRIEKGIWNNKPLLLLSTSPGKRGGLTVRNTAEAAFPRLGAKVTGSFSLPLFRQNFSGDSGITDNELRDAFFRQLDSLLAELSIVQNKAEN